MHHVHGPVKRQCASGARNVACPCAALFGPDSLIWLNLTVGVARFALGGLVVGVPEELDNLDGLALLRGLKSFPKGPWRFRVLRIAHNEVLRLAMVYIGQKHKQWLVVRHKPAFDFAQVAPVHLNPLGNLFLRIAAMISPLAEEVAAQLAIVLRMRSHAALCGAAW